MAFNLNKIFNYGTILFAILTLSWLATGQHGDGILFLSEHRNTATNFFFTNITKVGEEWTYVLLLVILLFYRFREAVLVFALAILVPAFSLTLKGFFARPRPKRFFTDTGIFDSINLVEGVELYSANTSFPSGHTMSAFAVLGFAAFVFRAHKSVGLSMLILAVLVAISRVYLVQHFLVDVCAGAIVGTTIAGIVSWIYLKLTKRNIPILNKNLLTFREKEVRV